MNLEEFFLALQAKEISPEDAKKELRKIKTVPEQSLNEESNQEIASIGEENRFVDNKDAVAIIGMSGRYPAAGNLEQYWVNLAKAKNSIQEVPKSRWDVNKYYDPRPSQKGKVYSKWIGLLEDIECFDPLFFNISPTEAEVMDPQHRIFLEEGYKAFEDAGYSRQLLNNKKCGVYLGIMNAEYGIMLWQNQASTNNITGNSYSIAAARIAYFLNLKGPAIAIDTACSSSLVATHLACQALLSNDIDMALVGGVTLYLTQEPYIGMCAAGMLSPDGQCKTFDQNANGFVPGEGAGALVLKRLKDAEADNDPIYGVIIGSGINQDGKTNGITAPSANSQAELEREIYNKNKIHPESISYVEMHGTGTKLGDPIELEALSTVFMEKTTHKEYCGIGSVKSNIGHTSAASGIASVQKVLLCMKYGKLVPTLNFQNPNEHFNFKESPFYINTELQPWKVSQGMPRRASVSSFGFSGTNAHIVIEEYIPKLATAKAQIPVNENTPILFALSTKSEQQLRIHAKNMKEYIESHADLNLVDMAYTLQVGREAMEYRLAFLADSRETLLKALKDFINNNSTTEVLTAQVKKSKDGVAAFKTDEDAEVLFQTLIQKRLYYRIAELWVKGLAFDWNKLYSGIKPNRISLPAYPFFRERYWIPQIKYEGGNKSPILAEDSWPFNTEIVIHTKEWHAKAIDTKAPIQSGVVAVLGTPATRKLAFALFEDMEALQVIQVIHDEIGSDEEILTDFYSSSAGESLYEQFKDKLKGRKILGVIDITAHDSAYEQSTTIESGKITFLQKIIEYDRNEGYRLLQATHKLHAFQLAAATIQGARTAGLYRMLGAEYKQIQAMSMDSDCSVENHTILAQQIQTEFLNMDKANPTECCYRKNERYEPYLAISQTSSAIQDKLGIPEKYDEHDVVLITGGTRGIGASIAEHVVSQGIKNLVIMGREALPEPAEWNNILDGNGKPEIEQKLKRMQSLISRGVRIRYYRTPLSDENGMKAMVQDIHLHLGHITGVFHCAGLTSRNPAFFKKSIKDFEAVCEPKMKGLVILHRALEEEPLDFFILFSSISSIVPTLSTGQSDYAMANAYMDYFAMNQVGEEKHYFKSVQWPAWRGTGMAAGGVHTAAYKAAGLTSLEINDGLALLDMVKRMPHIVSLPCMVVPGEFTPDHLLKTKIMPGMQKYGLELQRSSEQKPEASPAQQFRADLRTCTMQWLKQVFCSELKLSANQLNDEKPFDEYGVESIIMAQLVLLLQEKVSKKIDPSLILEYSTITALTDYFLANHAEDLQKNLGHEKKCVKEDFRISVNQPKVISEPKKSEEDIAIVGISCRLPGSPTKEAYWELLTTGVSAIEPVPPQRWSSKNNRQDYGGWIENIDLFDPQFFNINENDAAIMDPQARIILEESMHAIYDAGYEHKQLSGQKVGVYIGGRYQPNTNVDAILRAPNPVLGIGQNYLAANISRCFNFKGPSLVVDTACSSGITGMLLACDSLRERRTDMALIGAVSLLVNPYAHDLFAARNILSRNGEFHIFDKRSNGEVLGEGAGVVMIKRLCDAIKDGNHIYGIIKAIAVNNDGQTLGPGSPNINAQEQVMRDALTLSGKQLEDIGYIEVNGGGSAIVDSIEIKALSNVYNLGNKALKPCGIGSVKPNIGHLLLTAGMAGFIRCVLSVYHKKIPPFLSTSDPFSSYDFSSSRIEFNRKTIDWTVDYGKKRIAALNSFPDGGTNCHVILEEFVSDGNYRQQYFPRKAPDMVKKRFPISLPELSSDMEITKHSRAAITNIWGEYYEKEV